MFGAINVHFDQPIGTISPFLHGQFIKHLGECVYPGIWREGVLRKE